MDSNPAKVDRMQRRTRKLINTRLQLRMTLWFVGVAALVMFLQFFVMARTMSSVGLELPNDSQLFFENISGKLLQSFLAALGIALSLTMVAGILVTHRVAGPLFRFTQFLEAVKRGEHPEECRLRRGDQLHDFCALLNRFTAEMRAESRRESDNHDQQKDEDNLAA